MKPVKIILFNGPPGSGKDTAARAILDDHEIQDNFDRYFDRFAMPIKRAIGVMFDQPVDYYGRSRFDRDKEVVDPILCGMSYRTSLIRLGAAIRAAHGEGVFGTLLARRIIKHAETHGREELPMIVVVPDLGREGELEALYEYFLPDNVLIIKLSRSGKVFDLDSRTYVKPDRPRRVEYLNNNGVVEALQRGALRLVKDFLGVENADQQASAV